MARPASAAPASFSPRAAPRGHSAGARPPGTTTLLSPAAAPIAETLPPQRTAHCAPRSVPGSEADGACGGGGTSPLDAHSRTGSIAALRTHGGPPPQRPSGSAAADALCEKEKDHDAQKRSADAHPIDSATAGSEGPIPAAADRPTNAEAMPPHQPEEASGLTAPATDGDPSWRGVLPFALGWILVVCVLAAIAIGGVAIALVAIGSVGAEWLKERLGRINQTSREKQTSQLRWEMGARRCAPSDPSCSLGALEALATCTDQKLVLRPGYSMHSLAAAVLGASALEPGDNGRVTLAEPEVALLRKEARRQLMVHYVTFNHRRSPCSCGPDPGADPDPDPNPYPNPDLNPGGSTAAQLGAHSAQAVRRGAHSDVPECHGCFGVRTSDGGSHQARPACGRVPPARAPHEW